MTNPVWKKVKEIEPGLYWFGGCIDEPASDITTEAVTQRLEFNIEWWYARIGDVPPEPVMPPPELKQDDPVMVRDSEDGPWMRKHFAGWSISGDILCWCAGFSKWTSGNAKEAWTHWRLPTVEELNS